MNSADSCIRNYLCGNLEDAKRQARRVRSLVIYQALRARYGKTEAQAAASVVDIACAGMTEADRVAWIRTHDTKTGRRL